MIMENLSTHIQHLNKKLLIITLKLDFKLINISLQTRIEYEMFNMKIAVKL